MDEGMFDMLNGASGSGSKKTKKSKSKIPIPSTSNGEASTSTAPIAGQKRAVSPAEEETNGNGDVEMGQAENGGEDGEEEGSSSKQQQKKKRRSDAGPGLNTLDPMEALDSTNTNNANSASDSESDSDSDAGNDTIEAGDVTMDDPEPSAPKMPVVTDDFEQEAEREVAATSGFAKVEEGEKMRLVHQVRHQVALPPNYPYTPISSHVPHNPPARTYNFTLDPFQRVAVNSIERNESVLVSAHTSAGKTVVAEYAIATCLNEKKRVVYTSPIKALSNQKYREFQAEFGDVGLMTGDTTINPTASCLVMTTEILRSMLYRGSEVMREVAWVVFDEVHYMRDKERGVVWEETIILLPHSVRYVFLSATIPNSMQFAEWIAELHAQPCHVVYTDFRPTPLQHYLFPEQGEGMFLVVDEKGNFREDNFQKAMGFLAAKQGEDPADSRGGQGRKGKTKKGGAMQGEDSDIKKIVSMIMNRGLNPVIVFAFSKRECEALAMQLGKLNFNKDEESATVEHIFNNALSGLNEDDRQLPQISLLLPLLKKGVGVHHGGLLPLMKEVIEILFQEGLIKVLFATETFSIGLNMPAKTVIFTSVQKFDGKEFRHLSGGEYIQMSGRAGRRGLDARGIVIMMCENRLEPEAAKGMVKGQADRLDSAFHLGYNMILNLMRVEGVSPEFMLEKCFYQFQNTMNVPVLEKEQKELKAKIQSFQMERQEEIEEYHDIRTNLASQRGDYKAVITEPHYILSFIQPGRVLKVVDGDRDFGWGVAFHYEKRVWPVLRTGPTKPTEVKPQEEYIIFMLLNCAANSRIDFRDKTGAAIHTIQPAKEGEGEPVVIPVLLTCIDNISAVRLQVGRDARSAEARQVVWRAYKEMMRRLPNGLPLLDPVENMNIKDEKFRKVVKRITMYENRLAGLSISKADNLEALYNQYCDFLDLKKTIKAVKRRINEVRNVLQLEELRNRKRVLRRLGYTSDDDIISAKGRVACEISSGDELLLTELLMDGSFNNLKPDQCAALLSAFVFDEKSEIKPRLTPELHAAMRNLTEHARRIAAVSVEARLALVPDEYVNKFKVNLIEAVIRWCNGASFAEICEITDVFEGSLIRCFRRLHELIRQMVAAANVIGNEELKEKFEESIKLLERPNTIAFSPSLYL